MHLPESGNVSCKGRYISEIIFNLKTFIQNLDNVSQKSRTKVSAQKNAVLKGRKKTRDLLVSSGVFSPCTVGLLPWPVLQTAIARQSSPTTGPHLLEFAIYRSLTFSGVIQEAKMAVHQTSVEEEVVTLALMSLPSSLKDTIWRCSSGLMNLSRKVMRSVTMGR